MTTMQFVSDMTENDVLSSTFTYSKEEGMVGTRIPIISYPYFM